MDVETSLWLPGDKDSWMEKLGDLDWHIYIYTIIYKIDN